jgi:hypothetical protein
VTLDRAAHIIRAPRPAIRADAAHLPFPGATWPTPGQPSGRRDGSCAPEHCSP